METTREWIFETMDPDDEYMWYLLENADFAEDYDE